MTAAALSEYGERDLSLAIAQVRRRARLVAALRVALIAGVVVIAGHALARVALSDAGGEQSETLGPAGETERVVGARYTGRDEQGRPFTIESAAASRTGGATGDQADLQAPRLDYASLFGEQAQNASAALAEMGRYDEQSRTLSLEGSVRFSTRSGYVFRTEAASVDLENARIFGDAPIAGRAPWGEVQANGFEVRDRGDRIRFTGGVVMRFADENAAGDPAAQGDDPQ